MRHTHSETEMPAAAAPPSLNYCPYCGHALEDRLAFGRVRRACPACERIIFREHKIAAAVVVEDTAGRVLLVQRALNPHKGRWSLPAGFVEYNESPEAAAARECLEETGLHVAGLRLLAVVHGREHAHGADLVIVYRVHASQGVLHAADDAEAAQFFPLDALPPLAFKATVAALETLHDLRREPQA